MKHFQFIIICVLLASCSTHFQEYNSHGFGGGFGISKHKEIKLDLQNSNNVNIAEQSFIPINELSDTIQLRELNHSLFKQNNRLIIPQKQNKNIQKAKIQSFLELPQLLKSKLKKKFTESASMNNTNWSPFRTVLLILGLILLIISIFLAVIGGGSGNYYEVAMIGGLLLILSVILILIATWKAMKAGYQRLGFWGKLGFWMILGGVFTLGISTVIGIPIWIYGLVTGK